MWKFFTAESHSKYLNAMLIILLPFFLILALNYFILYQAGELQSVEQIAKKIQNKDNLFESGVHDLRRELNLELIKIRKPSIVAFGSSRPLSFRQEDFKDGEVYACACMAVPNLSQGKFYAEKMMAIHKPKVVILSVDFWWFTTPSGIRPPALFDHKPPMTLQKLIKPMQLVYDGTITFDQYWKLLKSGNDFAGVTTQKKEGLLGIIRGLGVRSDGSFLNGICFSNYSEDYYSKWRSILHNADDYIRGDDRYGPNKETIQSHIDDYQELVKMFHDNNIKVVAVMLPLAPTIYDALKKSPNHKHVFELANKISSFSDEFYDLHNPHLFTSDMCEYEDAHHAGDVVFMRVLRYIVQKNPKSILKGYVDQAKLNKYIKRYKGKTVATFDEQTYLTKEQDFTGFGCSK